jgi:DNA-binding NarL/FixJ family response regulator
MNAIKEMNSKPPFRVLVCDDSQLMLGTVHLALRRDPDFQTVELATGGREAILKAVQFKPDLVIMDVHMPDLDGIEATRQILRKMPGTRVLAFSSDLAWETVDAMFEAGASGYLVKGVGPTELIQAARAVLAGRNYLSLGLLESACGRA